MHWSKSDEYKNLLTALRVLVVPVQLIKYLFYYIIFTTMSSYIDARFYDLYEHESEFLQAVHEVNESITPYLQQYTHYHEHKILNRIVTPERVITFRVTWTNDTWAIHVNTWYRVEFNSALGPYKGGLRFHPNVNLSILKFLGFEQIFKNALTWLPLGGGKWWSDFDPKWKSDPEIMRFCQAFMTELSKHIGPDTDVPAGDIGVWSREIGYLYGQYKKLRNEHTGVLTGKGLGYGGLPLRTEATWYGLVYFVREMLATKHDSITGKKVIISGSGNVAQYAAEKVIELGGIVLTLSDSGGYIYDPDGISQEKLDRIKELKNIRRGRISEYLEQYQSATYHAGEKPRSVSCDIALPCATQNELNEQDAQWLINHGVQLIAEGANMPSTPEAIALFRDHHILFAPGKASNAWWVATSGLEMSQNAQKLVWTRDDVDQKLQSIMRHIHTQCTRYGTQDNQTNYVDGANIAWFVTVADAMIAQGI